MGSDTYEDSIATFFSDNRTDEIVVNSPLCHIKTHVCCKPGRKSEKCSIQFGNEYQCMEEKECNGEKIVSLNHNVIRNALFKFLGNILDSTYHHLVGICKNKKHICCIS